MADRRLPEPSKFAALPYTSLEPDLCIRELLESGTISDDVVYYPNFLAHLMAIKSILLLREWLEIFQKTELAKTLKLAEDSIAAKESLADSASKEAREAETRAEVATKAKTDLEKIESTYQNSMEDFKRQLVILTEATFAALEQARRTANAAFGALAELAEFREKALTDAAEQAKINFKTRLCTVHASVLVNGEFHFVSPLYLAILFEWSEGVRELILHGACNWMYSEIFAGYPLPETPLFLAMRHSFPITQLLLREMGVMPSDFVWDYAFKRFGNPACIPTYPRYVLNKMLDHADTRELCVLLALHGCPSGMLFRALYVNGPPKPERQNGTKTKIIQGITTIVAACRATHLKFMGDLTEFSGQDNLCIEEKGLDGLWKAFCSPIVPDFMMSAIGDMARADAEAAKQKRLLAKKRKAEREPEMD